MTELTVDVVHVGSASRDLTDDDPRGWRLGGGASYSALTTARLGLRTAALIGVDRAAATAPELDLLRESGVDVRLVALQEGPVFRNLELPAGRIQTCIAPGQSLAIPSLPAEWLAARIWSLVPVADEVNDSWVSAVHASAFLAVGWQGLLRVLEAGHDILRRPPARSGLLDRADLVAVSRHDLAHGTRLPGLLGLLRPGAELLVTDGPAGGCLLHLNGDGHIRMRRYRAVAADRQVDPTGAGDVFVAALIASMARPRLEDGRAPRRHRLDLRFAAAAASYVVEAPGLEGVPDRAAVLARLARRGSRPGLG